MIETLRRFLRSKRYNSDTDGSGRGRHGLSSSHYFTIWFIWLLIGTMVYGYGPKSNLGLGKGFYHAVNIGYSIGWGYPSEEYFDNYIWFSSAYVIVGASLVAVALGFFADKIVEDADNWFTNLLQEEEYKTNIHIDQPIITRIIAYSKYNIESIRAIGLWILWITIMIIYSLIFIDNDNENWNFREAQYFAISSCSTGGHWSIPNNSPDWLFGITGFFSALGVPIMGVAMATIATMLIDTGNIEEIKSTIEAKITKQELDMMRKFNLENNDGVIDRSEYIILCMVRMGTDPSIIQFVSDRFNKLDKDSGGTLDIKELLEEDDDCAFYASNTTTQEMAVLKMENDGNDKYYDKNNNDYTTISTSPSGLTNTSHHEETPTEDKDNEFTISPV